MTDKELYALIDLHHAQQAKSLRIEGIICSLFLAALAVVTLVTVAAWATI